VIGHASVIVADGKLILLNDSGELILARAVPRRYEELARVSLLGGEICWTAPALHRGCVYVRNHSRAVCVYVGKPELLDRKLRNMAMTVQDIPQSKYFDLATILGVEPEYAFDVPTARWLQTWYLFSVALLAAAMVLAISAWAALRNWTKERWLQLAVASVLGLIGTTLLSIGLGEFVFTWPLVLFVSFQTVIDQIRIGQQPPTDRPKRWWQTRIAALVFIIICLLYFLICRRLSLAAEWVFLTGFVAALPVALCGQWLRARSNLHPLVECLLMIVSFSAYYWASVAVLALKYDIAEV
jgi:hypothetical protein